MARLGLGSRDSACGVKRLGLACSLEPVLPCEMSRWTVIRLGWLGGWVGSVVIVGSREISRQARVFNF
jgi:hypothetical protein